MEKRIEEYMKKTIMEQSRHQFIYSYIDENRESFIEKLVKSYPVTIDEDVPMAIYIKDYGLPALEGESHFNQAQLQTISEEFLKFNIVITILKKSLLNIERDTLNKKMEEFLNSINRYEVQPGFDKIKNIEELIKVLELSKSFYQEAYKSSYIKEQNLTFDNISIPFLHLPKFIREIKESLSNNSYFGIIINNNQKIHHTGTQVINTLINGRINADVSMKIFTESNDWPTYIDERGQFIEKSHDYGIEELDDNYKKHIIEMKRKYQ